MQLYRYLFLGIQTYSNHRRYIVYVVNDTSKEYVHHHSIYNVI